MERMWRWGVERKKGEECKNKKTSFTLVVGTRCHCTFHIWVATIAWLCLRTGPKELCRSKSAFILWLWQERKERGTRLSVRDFESFALAGSAEKHVKSWSSVDRRVGRVILLAIATYRRNIAQKIIFVCSLFFFAPHSTSSLHPSSFLRWLIFYTYPNTHSQAHTRTPGWTGQQSSRPRSTRCSVEDSSANTTTAIAEAARPDRARRPWPTQNSRGSQHLSAGRLARRRRNWTSSPNVNPSRDVSLQTRVRPMEKQLKTKTNFGCIIIFVWTCSIHSGQEGGLV